MKRIVNCFKREGIIGFFIFGLDKISGLINKQSLFYIFFKWKYKNVIFYKDYMKKYKKYKNTNELRQIDNERIPVFVCWLQGIENAPDIVKCCYNNLRKMLNKEKYNLITIDSKNYMYYTSLPNFIVKKHANGSISNTHFSDIIRTNLLINYGGMWIDSTMLLTDNIPETIIENELFVFRFSPIFEERKQVASNQFIYAKNKNNEILIRTLNGLYYYWENNNKLNHYFMYHYLFAIAVSTNDITKKQFNKIPFYSSMNNHTLQYELLNKYNKNRFEYYKNITFIHKLTYKVDIDKIDVDSNYYWLLNNY